LTQRLTRWSIGSGQAPSGRASSKEHWEINCYNNNNGSSPTSNIQTTGLGEILQNLLTNAFPSPWLLIVLVLGYLVILGPVRFFYYTLAQEARLELAYCVE